MKKKIVFKMFSMVLCISVLFSALTAPVLAEVNTTQNENLNYDRDAARNYALDHYQTGTYNSAYHDYNGEGGDCTNFASQVLKAGGMSEKGVVGYLDYANWYYHFQFPTQVAHSWINAQVFKKHWAHDLNGVGTNRAYMFKRDTVTHFKNNSTSTISLLSTVAGGDIIQLTDSTGDSYHTMVITGFVFHPVTGDFDYQYVQHTSDKMGYLSDLLNDLYNSGNGSRDFIAMRMRK